MHGYPEWQVIEDVSGSTQGVSGHRQVRVMRSARNILVLPGKGRGVQGIVRSSWISPTMSWIFQEQLPEEVGAQSSGYTGSLPGCIPERDGLWQSGCKGTPIAPPIAGPSTLLLIRPLHDQTWGSEGKNGRITSLLHHYHTGPL